MYQLRGQRETGLMDRLGELWLDVWGVACEAAPVRA
jgi:hypothetical protein